MKSYPQWRTSILWTSAIGSVESSVETGSWRNTEVLISPCPDQEGNKLMFLSEWRKFPSVPCLAGKEIWWQLASRCCWNRARLWHASELVSFLVGLRTYQLPVSGIQCTAATILHVRYPPRTDGRRKQRRYSVIPRRTQYWLTPFRTYVVFS